MHLTVPSHMRIDLLAGYNCVRHSMIEYALGKCSGWDSTASFCHACHCWLPSGHANHRVPERGCGAVFVSLCFCSLQPPGKLMLLPWCPLVMLQLTWYFAGLQAVNKVQGKTEEKKQEGQGCTIM